MISNSNVVLVVDDSIDSIHMLNDVLEDAKFTVLVALEGTQALTITQNIRPDIILLDAIMPNMDGFETCKRLKQNPQLADVPIIFMTGLSDTEHIVMGLGAGGVDYITKPIKADELIARMQVHLANARITQSARAALDTAGQYLLTINAQGNLVWATPQVYQLLDNSGATQDSIALTPSITQQLRDWISHKPETGRQLLLQQLSTELSVEMLNLIDGKEYLLRLTPAHKPADDTQSLKQQFAVTGREADVLLWIANGKTNREIGQILEMSPRTVNKHLEQIFKKLGVENRTSAAAIAIRSLARG
ncbi:response regulator [Cellvibrio sp. QJXJ]|jgi:DNA-binding response OmpR family regulator/DNA-binding CsgD family transcriptional regulator|uniref:response regulator n=1 Tax=Cellvibrio sp. QJXJ TaxID=2964606 RepID=UPI0021C32BE7|nr:response regulator [Cellvibrio sp. QJXJ]UUA72492.1 response regulator [Cellvibrio sp. QJXJ]